MQNTKIPKPIKVGNHYRIQTMINGKRYSTNKPTSQECLDWFHLLQDELAPKAICLLELMDKYRNYSSTRLKSFKRYDTIISTLAREHTRLVTTDIRQITPKQLSVWRDYRQTQVSYGTVLLEMSFISCCFGYAINELYLLEQNPMDRVTKPNNVLPRYRRITDNEIVRICEWTKFDGTSPKSCRQQVGWCFMFAIETAMRRSEILALNRHTIFDNHVHVATSKNGASRSVPLSQKAKQLLSGIEPLDTKLFSITTVNFDLIWQRMRKQTGILDLHFHDTRHEAISRMVRDLNIPVEKLAKVTGHKSISILVNTYYNPTVDELSLYFNQ